MRIKDYATGPVSRRSYSGGDWIAVHKRLPFLKRISASGPTQYAWTRVNDFFTLRRKKFISLRGNSPSELVMKCPEIKDPSLQNPPGLSSTESGLARGYTSYRSSPLNMTMDSTTGFASEPMVK